MKIRVTYDINLICKNLLKERLDALGIPFEIQGNSEVILKHRTDSVEWDRITEQFAKAGIQILDDEKLELVERIKEVIHDMIHSDSDAQKYKVSVYLSKKLKYSYGHLANSFSEATYTSIRRYIILCKIDYAKSLISQGTLTITDIAYKLNYSSVAHLSNQFKGVTGLKPTVFQDIVAQRRQHHEHTLNHLI